MRRLRPWPSRLCTVIEFVANYLALVFWQQKLWRTDVFLSVAPLRTAVSTEAGIGTSARQHYSALFNTIQRQSDAEKVSEVEQELKAAVKESEDKFAQLKREGAAAQAEFIEVMEQAEAEFDDNSDRLKQELLSTKQAAKETEEDLHAQTHVYTRCAGHPAGSFPLSCVLGAVHRGMRQCHSDLSSLEC